MNVIKNPNIFFISPCQQLFNQTKSDHKHRGNLHTGFFCMQDHNPIKTSFISFEEGKADESSLFMKLNKQASSE